jgi:hypothetical protein
MLARSQRALRLALAAAAYHLAGYAAIHERIEADHVGPLATKIESAFRS